jgi:hypothetical protein
MSSAAASKLFAERLARLRFLPDTALRLGRPLLVGSEDGGVEVCEDWEEEAVSWVPVFSYAEITEPLFLLFIAWPKVTLASGFCTWGWGCEACDSTVIT